MRKLLLAVVLMMVSVSSLLAQEKLNSSRAVEIAWPDTGYLRFGQANYGTSGLDFAFRATESTAVVVNLRESYWISHQDDFVTYRGGVRYSKRPGNRITGFAQVLAGTAIGYKAQCDCSSNPSIDRGNGFSFSAGGGLDVGLKKWFGVRVIQADYEMTRVKGHTSNGIRLGASLVFRIGK